MFRRQTSRRNGRETTIDQGDVALSTHFRKPFRNHYWSWTHAHAQARILNDALGGRTRSAKSWRNWSGNSVVTNLNLSDWVCPACYNSSVYFHIVFQEEELINQCMSPSTAGVNSFKLHDRAKHVYSEASRVLKFKTVCEETPANAIQVRKIQPNISSHCLCFLKGLFLWIGDFSPLWKSFW